MQRVNTTSTSKIATVAASAPSMGEWGLVAVEIAPISPYRHRIIDIIVTKRRP